MFFIAFASFIAYLVAIAASVLAAILISTVRFANAPTASKLDTTEQGKRPKKLTVSRHAKLKCLLLKLYLNSKFLTIGLLNVKRIAGFLKSNQIPIVIIKN